MGKNIHELAGHRVAPAELVTRSDMQEKYYRMEAELPPVKNGTSGHRGLTGVGFTDRHVAAMIQALVDIRKEKGSFGPELPSELLQSWKLKQMGPIICGKDVRFTSDFALITAAEVFAGNGMKFIIQSGNRATPTPVISRTILRKNQAGLNVEGVVITASHNPPDDAGCKSNGRDGGPNTATKIIDEKANFYLKHPDMIERIPFDKAIREKLVVEEDFMGPYIEDLKKVVDFSVLRNNSFAATSLGGAAHGYYQAISDTYGLSITELLSEPDPAGAGRTRDWDGKLRGDPSSSYVMKAVEGMREKLGVPFVGANDNDADRFGGEDGTAGILNPNHVLCVIFDYLNRFRSFSPDRFIGRTIGTTHMLDLIAADYKRPVHEVNVGFKYYVAGLLAGKYVLAGEESAGLSLPQMDGSPWVTEKDGLAAVLLMMEIIARTGKDIGTLYNELVKKYGPHQYERIDAPATPDKKSKMMELAGDPNRVKSMLENKTIAGKAVERIVVGDGIKVVLESGIWVLKRPSGTENIIKDYREERGDTLNTARKASIEIDHLLGLPEE